MFEYINKRIVKILDDKYELRGTGFFVSKEGHIVTCWHVIEDLSSIYIINFQGEKYRAQKLDCCCNPGNDIAILKININKELEYLCFDKNFKEEEKIYSVGFPKNYLEILPNGLNIDGALIGPTLIEDQGSRYRVLQLKDVEIQCGMSGAPVVSMRKKVIGIISGKFGQREYGIAIPSESILTVLKPLYLNGEGYRGIFYNYIKRQYKLPFNEKLIDQHIVPINIREIDLFGERKNPITFTNFRNEMISLRRWNAIIIGEAGIGKTTELLNLTKFLSRKTLKEEKQYLIPIFVELRSFRSENGNADDLINHLIHITAIIEKRELLEEFQQEEQFLIIFDGINEIDSKYLPNNINALIDFMKIYSNFLYIISTRYYTFDNRLMNIIGVPMKTYEIQRWDNKQIKNFFLKNHGMALYQKLDTKIKNLCSIPFSASLFLKSYQYNSGREYPKNKGELYKNFIKYIFTVRDSKIKNKFTKKEKNLLLANIAYIMNKREILNVKYMDIQNDLSSLGISLLNDEIIIEIIRSGILKKGGGFFLLEDLTSETIIEFTHQSIQEYFTALYISMEKEYLKYINMNDLENIYCRDIPIYLVGLLDNPLLFIDSLLDFNYLLIAAKCLMSCNCNTEELHRYRRKIIKEYLINSIQEQFMNKDAIEIVKTLGKESINLLLSYLDEKDEIINIIALSGDEYKEKKWRKYGRIIYILGELNVYGLIQKLKDIYKEVKDIHLLYHIVIAFYTLKYDEAINIFQDKYLKEHNDPVIRTFALLKELRTKPKDKKLFKKREDIIQDLTNNLNIKDEMKFAIRAHSAEALGLLGIKDAIDPLFKLLKKEKRPEPQSSAIKALGYIAKNNKGKLDINRKIINILLNILESNKIDNNEWGIKYTKELLKILCTKNDTNKISNSIKKIEESDFDKTIKLLKINILNEVTRLAE